MGTIVIRDLPDDLHERLKAQAKRNHRSLTKEAVALIERQLTDRAPCRSYRHLCASRLDP